MAFDGTWRILFESDGSNINKQARARIAEIESQAAKIRAEGGNTVIDLAPQVKELSSAVSRATVETISALDGELAEIESAYKTQRDRHPERELVQIRRAENEIGAMADDGFANIVENYGSDESISLSVPAINVVRQRLRMANRDTELAGFNGLVTELNGDKPWLHSEEATKLSDYRGLLSKLKPGEILYQGSEGRFPIPVGDLIDYGGDLDRVAE